MNNQEELKKTLELVINSLNGSEFSISNSYSPKDKLFFQDRYFELLKRLPEIKKNYVGLEVGLAGGVLATVIKRVFKPKKLYALEHPFTVKQYTKEFLGKIKKEGIELEPVDLRKGKLPWKDDTFDFILFCDVVEHLVPADVPDIMSEFKRILRKNGFLVLVTPNMASMLKRINMLRGKNPIEFDLRYHEGATFGHIREYTMHELETVAKDSGFKVERKGYFMIDSKRSMFTRMENIGSRFYKPFANSLMLLLRK